MEEDPRQSEINLLLIMDRISITAILFGLAKTTSWYCLLLEFRSLRYVQSIALLKEQNCYCRMNF